MSSNVKIVDTTLRDGEQRPGVALKISDKVNLAKTLDEMGVYEIEAGIPSVGMEGTEYYDELRKEIKNSQISVWTRTNLKDIEDAIKCKPDIIHIGMPISYVQIYSKLNKNKVWVHKTITECMDLILSHNIRITVGFEDASRADEGFMIETAKLIESLGGNAIRIADTVGVLTPQRTNQIIKRILDKVDIEIEFHGHNDLGMAIPNSILALKAGAKYIDCTLLGIGERSGNCDLREFVHSVSHVIDLDIKKDKISQAEDMLLNIFRKQIG